MNSKIMPSIQETLDENGLNYSNKEIESEDSLFTTDDGDSGLTICSLSNESNLTTINEETALSSIPIPSMEFISTVNPQSSDKYDDIGLKLSVSEDKYEDNTLLPYLEGKYIKKNGVAYWNGKWCFGKNNFISAKNYKFEFLSQTKPENSDNYENNEHISDPISGIYNGYFYEPNRFRSRKKKRLNKVKENNFEFNFIPKEKSIEGTNIYTLIGKGQNKYGSFEIKGEYDAHTDILYAKKVYLG